MKRNYVKPILNSEAFVPQTYVAACKRYVTAKGTNVTFNCDLATWFDDSNINLTGYTIYDANGNKIGTFDQFCELNHTIDTSQQNTFKVGIAKKNFLWWEGVFEEIQIFYYTDSNNNIHCSRSLAEDNWVEYTHS